MMLVSHFGTFCLNQILLPISWLLVPFTQPHHSVHRERYFVYVYTFYRTKLCVIIASQMNIVLCFLWENKEAENGTPKNQPNILNRKSPMRILQACKCRSFCTTWFFIWVSRLDLAEAKHQNEELIEWESECKWVWRSHQFLLESVQIVVQCMCVCVPTSWNGIQQQPHSYICHVFCSFRHFLLQWASSVWKTSPRLFH